MLTDILTVMSKELREIVFPDGRLQGGARNILIFVGLVGLVFPLQTGPSWFTSWMTVQAACFPVILVLTYTADSFAGERERRTIETLLATRLPALAILVGKMLAIVGYVWALVVGGQVVAVVGLNAVYRGRGLMFYRPAILVSILAVSFLVSLLLSSIGVLVSLTAPTVRAAGQRMLLPFLALVALPAAVPFLVSRLPWEERAAALTPPALVSTIAAACALLSALFLAVAIERFTRERVVLS